MAYADFEYYSQNFGGNAIVEADFPALSVRASAFVDAATMGRAKTATGSNLVAVQNAVCEIAEIFQDEQRMNSSTFSASGALSSESVGQWTRNYSTRTATAAEMELLQTRKRDALLMYFSGTGLMAPAGQPMWRGGFPYV